MMQKHKTCVVVGCGIVLLGVGLYGAGHDACAAAVQISVTDTKFSFVLEPGEERTMTIPVTNEEGVPVTIAAGALDYRVADENAIVVEQIDERERSLRQWVTTDTPQITIPAHGTVSVAFSLRVPDDAALGSHHGLLTLYTTPDATEPRGAQVMTQGQVGVHLLVNVRGQSRADGAVESFVAPIFVTSHPVAYAAVFRNTGNVHYVPAAAVRARNVLTMATQTTDINPDDRFAFPGTRVTLRGEQRMSPWGLYRVQMQVVDGDRAVHNRMRMAVGVFFPFVLAGVGGAAWGVWVWMRRMRTVHGTQ